MNENASSASTEARRPYAIVTGASSGIGYELARCCAESGFDLLIAADEPQIEDAARELRALGVDVQAVQADLATTEGVAKLHDAARGRPVDALLANAGRGLGKAFLSQDFNEVRRVVDSNITGTLALLHRVVPGMQQRQQGRVLITGSIAGFMPGSFQAVYNGTKAFIDSFAAALRNELQGSGVTVTCLLPGATDTKFFARADLLDTKLGQGPKDDARDVATAGFEAMMRGNASVITGTKNKLQVAIAKVTPATALARTHRKMAAPGSAEQRSSSGIGIAAGAIAALAIAGVALNRYVQQQRRAHPLRRLYRYSR